MDLSTIQNFHHPVVRLSLNLKQKSQQESFFLKKSSFRVYEKWMEDGTHLVQGKLTNFFLWSRLLSLDEMQQMTDSCNHKINKTGNF